MSGNSISSGSPSGGNAPTSGADATVVSSTENKAFQAEMAIRFSEMEEAGVPIQPQPGTRYCQELFRTECAKLRLSPLASDIDVEFEHALGRADTLKNRIIEAFRPKGGPEPSAGAAGGGGSAPPKKKLRDAAPDPLRADGGVGGMERALKRGTSVIPELIKGRSIQIECITPAMWNHIEHVQLAQTAITSLASELLLFKGELGDLPAAEFETAEPGPILADGLGQGDLDRLRASLISKLDALRVAARGIRDTGVRLQRLFWLAEFTQGCNWETVLQLIHREEHDEMGDHMAPCHTRLTSWDDQIRAAIIGAHQQKAGLAKDGKTLVGTVHPRLLCLHSRAGLHKAAEASVGAPSRVEGADGGPVGPPGSVYGRGHPIRWRGGGGGRGRGGLGRGGSFAKKENRQPNQAAHSAPAKPRGGKGK